MVSLVFHPNCSVSAVTCVGARAGGGGGGEEKYRMRGIGMIKEGVEEGNNCI